MGAEENTEHQTGEHAEILAVRRGAAHSAKEASRAQADAEGAVKEVERLAGELRMKDEAITTVTARADALKAELSGLALDDPGAEKPASQLLHATIIKDKLRQEWTGLHDSLVLAQERAKELHQAAEVAEATARNAGRRVTLRTISLELPVLVVRLLDLLRDHHGLIAACDEDSRTFDVPRVRQWLFPLPTDWVSREDDTILMNELGTLLDRPPNARRRPASETGAPSRQGGSLLGATNGDEPPPPDEPTEPEPEEWVAEAIAAEALDEWVDAATPFEGA